MDHVEEGGLIVGILVCRHPHPDSATGDRAVVQDGNQLANIRMASCLSVGGPIDLVCILLVLLCSFIFAAVNVIFLLAAVNVIFILSWQGLWYCCHHRPLLACLT